MLWRFAILLAAATTLASPAAAQSFTQFFAFGDSTTDSGYFRYQIGSQPFNSNLGGANSNNTKFNTSVLNGGGLPTTPYGVENSQVLAAYFGLTANPSDQPGGGTNYAASGALINSPTTGFNAPSVVSQINSYLSSNNGVADPNALYLISVAPNDAKTTGITTDQIVQVAADLAAAIASLHAAGAQYIIVPGGGKRPPGDSGINPVQTPLINAFRDALWSDLAAAGINFIPADVKAVATAIGANPTSFGIQFVDSSQPACINPHPSGGSGPIITSSWALYCTPSLLVSPDAASTHLWADDEHYAAVGQKILGDYYYSLIVAPSMMSMLAEAPVKLRSAHVGAIQNQIPISQRERGPTGWNTWLSGDVSSLRIKNYSGFPDDPGTPTTLTGGFDYLAPSNWLIGVALSAGRQKASFSLSFGGFTQNDFAASVYVAHIVGPYWFDVIATYGRVNYDVGRNVPIGITIQNNTASTSGSNISLAGETGYSFTNWAFTHGPYVGLALQQVYINGFTESGSFTALGFASQTRNSAISALGYQVSYDAGIWRPFTKAAWNHEFASTNRLVTASLTTITAPSYSLPAPVLGKDWATATVGTTVKIRGNLTGLLAFTSQMAQRSVTTYGGQVGVNVAF